MGRRFSRLSLVVSECVGSLSIRFNTLMLMLAIKSRVATIPYFLRACSSSRPIIFNALDCTFWISAAVLSETDKSAGLL